MRTIERSKAFRKDYKKLSRTIADLDALLVPVLKLLVADEILPEQYRDHSLGGNWNNYRDCHIKPDLVLIYSKTNENILKLARIGSHSELF